MKSIHFIGIGGVGMAGLAFLEKAAGNSVSGCDLKPTPRTCWLAANDIAVTIGHDPSHIDKVDEVVVTPAVKYDEAELTTAHRRGITIRYRGEVLAQIVNSRDSIAVCGSHGKTTTATWIAKLLKALGEDVAWCIGGETGDFPVAGKGEGPLVVEADESDGTLELYHASTLVITNCEYDHPDHFKTVEAYRACYDLAKRNAKKVIESEKLAAIELPIGDLPLHNQKNARAAVEVALQRGHKLADIIRVLPAIVEKLPNRRFQKIADGVYIDYAHHPTEMRCAIEMARQKCRGTLRVLFQPHRYSRTKALIKEFPAAFAQADEVVLCPTYAAFERPVEGGDIADLYATCRGTFAAEKRLYLARSCEEAWTHAKRSSQVDDVILVLGAGDIVDKLKMLPPRRQWIGAGTNTWKSDLNLAIEYVRTKGPADRPGATLGIPWMVGVPGTIGGWVKMNAGAFGHSISELVEEVKVDGQWIKSADCGFGYRHSNIRGEIEDVRFRPFIFSSDEPTAGEYLSRRKQFPAGTYGSVFKNPANDFAGRLLEAVGAKGLKVGGAYVWSEHANVIVRGEGATASDVLALARLMHNRVQFRLGITLESEVQF